MVQIKYYKFSGVETVRLSKILNDIAVYKLLDKKKNNLTSEIDKIKDLKLRFSNNLFFFFAKLETSCFI